MGRRKERRLAAMSAAGRRVKLDLFAEPSGDLGGSVQDGVEGNDASRSRAGLPNSPSSSGQHAENPLLLLEQYSDDELDEESNEGRHRAPEHEKSNDIDSLVEAGTESEDAKNDDSTDPLVPEKQQLVNDNDSSPVDPQQKLEENIGRIKGSSDLHGGKEGSVEKVMYPAASDVQVVGDVSSGWKIVLHEESNQYYYWNIETGQTSWEIPDVLALTTESTAMEEVAADAHDNEKDEDRTCKSSISLDMEGVGPTGKDLDNCPENNANTKYMHEELTGMGGLDGGLKGNGTTSIAGANKHTSEGSSYYEYEAGSYFYPHLLKHCETLLEQLNSVKGLNCYQQKYDLISRYTAEVEVRLSDIQALASHASSLMPFWMHSDKQLERLEGAINDALQDYKSDAQASKAEPVKLPHKNTHDELKVESSERKALFPAGNPQISEYAATIELQRQLYNGAYTDSSLRTEHITSVGDQSTYHGKDSGERGVITGPVVDSESTPKTVFHSEDVDMDVDMEVEETVPSINSSSQTALGGQCHTPAELSNPNNTAQNGGTEQIHSVLPPTNEGWIPPPPPDDEPIPPPPPDDEPIPPPPPDEPPQISLPPPSHLGSVQPYSYADQYNLAFPGSNIELYGQATEASSNALYTHIGGCQADVSHVPNYYETVSNAYSAAPLLVNAVEPNVYYGPGDGVALPAPLTSGISVDPSGIHGLSVAESLGSESSLLTGTKVNAVETSSEIPVLQPSIGPPGTTSVADSIAASSTSPVRTSISTATTESKAQTKVSRNKKRTAAVVSSLRSNKKVSSLVDKWKAAKEELHQDEEEEPENAYEKLKKKRLREIEAWHAQQIASGEAKDNANFQPLGGDWRERVKRKRARILNETVEPKTDVISEGNQQPDLDKLSKGLRPGWQAYWDDSTKQVYYGNTVTSETTWIRPTA